MAAHFGEMLLDRRRQLGLSIQQVANIIKIRPQIIEYFECENFAAMPPRGYAQGMISSYARYLGLNPREVVDAYFDALHIYERSLDGGRVGRLQDSVADASPRSMNATGRFLMVNNAATAGSRFASRPPQAGYVSESTSLHEPVAATRLRGSADRLVGRDAMRPPRGSARAPYGAGEYASGHRYGDVSARGYQDASDGYGRLAPGAGGPRGSRPVAQRQHGAAVGRPMPGEARRRAMDGRDPRRGASQPTRSRASRGRGAGAAPAIDSRLLVGGLIGLVVIVALLVMLLMRGCAPQPAADAGSADAPKTAPAADASDTDDASNEDDGADTSGTADADADTAADDAPADTDAAAADGSDTAAAEPQETKVTVELAGEGTVAWIEVDLDGSSVLAAQQVGPFEQEFTVTQQIEVVTNKPSDVSVYVNGKKVRYDMKASGVAKVTITVPKTDDATGDAATTDGATDAAAGTSGTTAAVQ